MRLSCLGSQLTHLNLERVGKLNSEIYWCHAGVVVFLLSTTRRICPKYGEIQTGMYFFCIHRRPGTMDSVINFRFFNNISESM